MHLYKQAEKETVCSGFTQGCLISGTVPIQGLFLGTWFDSLGRMTFSEPACWRRQKMFPLESIHIRITNSNSSLNERIKDLEKHL